MALLLSVFTSVTLVFAAAKGKDNPAITLARQKMAERDRAGAIQILSEAIQVEKSASRQAQLLKEQHQLATIFFSNEGQRVFELAESIRLSGQQGHLQKYEEALQLEGTNWNVLMGAALGYVNMKNCKKALILLNDAEKINPGRDEVKVLQYRAETCGGEPTTELRDTEYARIKNLRAYKKVGFAQRALRDEKIEAALRAAREAISADADFPMGYYWAWQTLKNEQNSGLDEAQKYISFCKSLTPVLRRKYYWEPELCMDTESVDAFLKKSEGTAP